MNNNSFTIYLFAHRATSYFVLQSWQVSFLLSFVFTIKNLSWFCSHLTKTDYLWLVFYYLISQELLGGFSTTHVLTLPNIVVTNRIACCNIGCLSISFSSILISDTCDEQLLHFHSYSPLYLHPSLPVLILLLKEGFQNQLRKISYYIFVLIAGVQVLAVCQHWLQHSLLVQCWTVCTSFSIQTGIG